MTSGIRRAGIAFDAKGNCAYDRIFYIAFAIVEPDQSQIMTKRVYPEGVITAAVTPMRKDQTADAAMLAGHCKSLMRLGSDGIVLLGTTGEANSFSVSERMRILEDVLSLGLDNTKLMAGTGCNAITDTIGLTRHALDAGVTNVLMLPPFYYKPVTDDALFAYFSGVIEGIGSDSVSIYLYHIPQNTGIDLSFSLIERLLAKYPGTIAGIKDSAGDWNHINALITRFPGFRVYSGTEEFLIPTMSAGGAGCISAIANVSIRCLGQLMHAYRNETETERFERKAILIREQFKGLPFVGTLKAFLHLQSGNADWRYLRPPNTLTDDALVGEIFRRCEALLETSIMETQ